MVREPRHFILVEDMNAGYSKKVVLTRNMFDVAIQLCLFYLTWIADMNLPISIFFPKKIVLGYFLNSSQIDK